MATARSTLRSARSRAAAACLSSTTAACPDPEWPGRRAPAGRERQRKKAPWPNRRQTLVRAARSKAREHLAHERLQLGGRGVLGKHAHDPDGLPMLEDREHRVADGEGCLAIAGRRPGRNLRI